MPPYLSDSSSLQISAQDIDIKGLEVEEDAKAKEAKRKNLIELKKDAEI